MAQITMFPEFFKVGAQITLPGNEDALSVDEQKIIHIPNGVVPRAFNITLFVPTKARVIIAQKDIGTTEGEYNSPSQRDVLQGSYVAYQPTRPIEVKRVGQNVWTSWHQENPNRVDCWYLGDDGELQLFQIGVITHDNGRTFRVLGEPRWKGQLFQTNNHYAPRPHQPKWGPLGTSRLPIFTEPGFLWLLSGASLSPWKGTDEELDPPLNEVPSQNHARVDWYVSFAGQTGQGIAKLQDGSAAWIHGSDIKESPYPDGIKRLFHNELVSFKGEPQKWGTKNDAPPKLVGVRRI